MTIEASNNVKLCALKLAYLLVPMLAESKPLLGENLDDVVGQFLVAYSQKVID